MRRFCFQDAYSAINPRRLYLAVGLGIAACLVSEAQAQNTQPLQAKADPYGYPRPAPDETHVPVRTSLFFELGFNDENTTDAVLADSVTVRIGPQGGPAVDVIMPGQRFAEAYKAKIFPGKSRGPVLIVYIDGEADLKSIPGFSCTKTSTTSRSNPSRPSSESKASSRRSLIKEHTARKPRASTAV